jgi:hypothetical protein
MGFLTTRFPGLKLHVEGREVSGAAALVNSCALLSCHFKRLVCAYQASLSWHKAPPPARLYAGRPGPREDPAGGALPQQRLPQAPPLRDLLGPALPLADAMGEGEAALMNPACMLVCIVCAEFDAHVACLGAAR